MYYFAYGSNMSSKRLLKRVPSAVVVGVFGLSQHRLAFHKASKDGSAKCDAFYSGDDGDAILGVVFHIDAKDKKALDRAEGLGYGYEIKHVRVADEGGERVDVFLYVATNINARLLPFSWYKNHVLVGAREAGLPGDYVKKIDQQVDKVDEDEQRAARENAIHH